MISESTFIERTLEQNPLQGSPLASQDKSAQEFARLLQQSLDSKEDIETNAGKTKHRKQLEEAARQMEIQMVTMMFRTMEKTSSENGMLGGEKSAGMSHFKDMFFQNVAEQMVEQQGLGFAEFLLRGHGLK